MSARDLRLLLVLPLLCLMQVDSEGAAGSPLAADACGPCDGDSSCQIISGIFTEPRLEEGYRPVAQIPAGACRIHIEELTPTSNYLALRDVRQRFIVNGDWSIDNSGQYTGAGATFVYRRQSDAVGEVITAVGPIKQPVDIYILYRQANRGIKYEYTIQKNSSLTSVLPRLPGGSGLPQVPTLPVPPRRPPVPPGLPQRRKYPGKQRKPASGGIAQTQSVVNQHLQPASPVGSAASDGTGFVSPVYQQRRVSPQSGRRRGRRPGRGRGVKTSPRVSPTAGGRGSGSTVPARPSSGRAGTRRQRHRRRRRRRGRFQWVVRGHAACSKTCGGGTKLPDVVCVRRKRKQLVRDSKCEARRRPRVRPVPCNTAPCPASSSTWQPTAWSECSTSCGAGHQRRSFLCTRAGQPVEVSECAGQPDLPSTRSCDPGPCRPATRWQIGQWSPCSVSCGWGSRSRTVTCTDPSAAGWCVETDRPRDTAPCRRPDCDPARQPLTPAGWMVTEWTPQCSVECGEGVQSRGVTCGGASGRCHTSQRPADTRPCETELGCGGVWLTGPWSRCSQECGPGFETRLVVCASLSAGQLKVTTDSSCASARRPAERRACGAAATAAAAAAACPPRWFASDWTSCSASCGPGRQQRVVSCVGADGRRADGCDADRRPDDSRHCHLADCPGENYHVRVEWMPSPDPELRLLHG